MLPKRQPAIEPAAPVRPVRQRFERLVHALTKRWRTGAERDGGHISKLVRLVDSLWQGERDARDEYASGRQCGEEDDVRHLSRSLRRLEVARTSWSAMSRPALRNGPGAPNDCPSLCGSPGRCPLRRRLSGETETAHGAASRPWGALS